MFQTKSRKIILTPVSLTTGRPHYYAPNFEKVGDILVSACPYVCMYVRTYSCSRYRLETSCVDS